jgi:hypothetical protein
LLSCAAQEALGDASSDSSGLAGAVSAGGLAPSAGDAPGELGLEHPARMAENASTKIMDRRLIIVGHLVDGSPSDHETGDGGDTSGTGGGAGRAAE